MYELKKIGKVLTSKSVGTGPSSYEKRIYRSAVLQRLRHIELDDTRRRKRKHSVWKRVCTSPKMEYLMMM